MTALAVPLAAILGVCVFLLLLHRRLLVRYSRAERSLKDAEDHIRARGALVPALLKTLSASPEKAALSAAYQQNRRAYKTADLLAANAALDAALGALAKAPPPELRQHTQAIHEAINGYTQAADRYNAEVRKMGVVAQMFGYAKMTK